MSDESMISLVDALRGRYGDRLHPYGSSIHDKHGFGFTIDGINAVFSAVTMEGTLPPGRYDIQFESKPPGEYLYTAQVDLQELLSLIDLFAGPESTGPTTNWLVGQT